MCHTGTTRYICLFLLYKSTLLASSLQFWPKIRMEAPLRDKTRSDKEIILIRHGTTEMNEHLRNHNSWGSPAFVDANLFDTRLSKQGVRDAELLNGKILAKEERIGDLKRVELLVSSPLTRALQTAELSFAGDILPATTPRLVLPSSRERLYMSSEIGRPKDILIQEFPRWDYSLVPDDIWWYVHPEGEDYVEWRPKGVYACPGEPESVFVARMKELRDWLLRREERVICVVCHWGVARALSGLSFENCDIKFFAEKDLLLEPFIDPF